MIDYIADNPYRILGVFANDAVRARTANIARIRAFNKVGKTCEFESDFTDIFGNINRSEETIDKAVSMLASDADAKFYSYFWIHKTPFLDTEAKAAADIIRSGFDSADISSYVNVIIGALSSGNNELAAQYIVKLFNIDNDLDDNTKVRIIGALINSRYSGLCETIDRWWNLFKKGCSTLNSQQTLFDLLEMDSSKEDPQQLMLKYLCPIFNKYAIEYLNGLHTKSDSNDVSNLKFIHYSLANPTIDVIKDTCDFEQEQLRAESQLALSDYAAYILELCKKCYHNNRYWDADPVEEIIKILRQAYRISYSSKVKDECVEFGKKLKAELGYLAPKQIKSQLQLIKTEVDVFCSKTNETRWALLLLRNCVKPLIEIKESLGKDNLCYRHLSTRIADNALYACQYDVAAAKRKYKNPSNDKELARKNLLQVLKLALQLKVDIAQLDMEEQFIVDKFSQFKDSIASDCEMYNLQEPNPSISLRTQYEIFSSCSDYNSLVEFTLSYPDSPYFQEAIRKIWGIEDKQYPTHEVPLPLYRKALLSYKEKYPNSHNEAKLYEELNSLLLGPSAIGTAYEYRTLLRLYPEHPKKSIILGRLDLASFKMCSTVSSLKEYLKDFPNGQHREEALKLINDALEKSAKEAFAKCRTTADFNNFVRDYPTSQLFFEAIKKIEDLAYDNALRSGNHREYYKQYPQGRYVEKLRQIEESNIYKNCKTTKEYKRYLNAYPNGLYAEKARTFINRAKLKRTGVIIAIIFAILLCIWSIKCTISNDTSSNQSNMIEAENIISDDSIAEDVSIENNETTDDLAFSDDIDWDGALPSDKMDAEIRASLDKHLSTGAKPYSSQLGRANTGDNYLKFKTSKGCDYVIIVRRASDGKYFNHTYIRGGEQANVYLPDGTFMIYFYSGVGWNPNKAKGSLIGGFVTAESLQEDGPIELFSAYCEYTLYPVKNGNLSLKGATETDVFN